MCSLASLATLILLLLALTSSTHSLSCLNGTRVTGDTSTSLPVSECAEGSSFCVNMTTDLDSISLSMYSCNSVSDKSLGIQFTCEILGCGVATLTPSLNASYCCCSSDGCNPSSHPSPRPLLLPSLFFTVSLLFSYVYL